MTESTAITLSINGEERRAFAATTRTLLDVLRDDFNLTGAKCGCNQGVCGACTVLCDGLPVRACLALAVSMTSRKIQTIEDAQDDEVMSLVQRSFVDFGAIQCGFCTPGMIISAAALLKDNRTPNDHEIRDALSGNLCRCTGYMKIIEAVHDAARQLAGGEASGA